MGSKKRGSEPRLLERTEIELVKEEVTNVPATIVLTTVLAAPVVFFVGIAISCSRNSAQIGC